MRSNVTKYSGSDIVFSWMKHRINCPSFLMWECVELTATVKLEKSGNENKIPKKNDAFFFTAVEQGSIIRNAATVFFDDRIKTLVRTGPSISILFRISSRALSMLSTEMSIIVVTGSTGSFSQRYNRAHDQHDPGTFGFYCIPIGCIHNFQTNLGNIQIS